MLLVVAATELEMSPVRRIFADNKDWQPLVTGVGCLETAAVLGDYLRTPQGAAITMVINFGVAGAFLDTGVGLLDICLAERETLADLGVCLGDEILPLSGLAPQAELPLHEDLLRQAESALLQAAIPYFKGTFATVNSVSGTAARGNFLRDRVGGICENMEGAAVARICLDFSLPCLELRCVSNMVEDRNTARWQLDDAIAKGAEALAALQFCFLR